jgi:hypothetical protein
VDDRRKLRIARNEASFRDIHERLNQGLQQVPLKPELLEFICECGNQSCEQHVNLSLSEYERVRRDSRRFAVAPGHMISDAERLVLSNVRFDVVEKLGEAVELTDEADWRVPGAAAGAARHSRSGPSPARWCGGFDSHGGDQAGRTKPCAIRPISNSAVPVVTTGS